MKPVSSLSHADDANPHQSTAVDPLALLENLRRHALSYASLMMPWASDVSLKLQIDGQEFPIPIPPPGWRSPVVSETQTFTPGLVQRRILRTLSSGPKTATQLRAMNGIGARLYDVHGIRELRDAGAVDRSAGKFSLTEYGEELAEEFEDE